MPKIFITGGISSGKSGFAEETAVSIYESIYKSITMQGHPLHFIATAKFNDKSLNHNSNNNESRNDENIVAAIDIDEEMALKIKKHKDKRNPSFAVHENFEDLSVEIKGICGSLNGGEGIILIDSMTLWLSSIFKSLSDYDFALENISKLSKELTEIKCSVITVADSLAFNMVPVDAYARKFIELNGLMEQQLSALSDKAYCVIAGNPVSLK